MLKDPRALQPLLRALRSEDVLLRWTAAGALEQKGDAAAIRPLIAAIRDDVFRGADPIPEWEPVRSALIHLLETCDGRTILRKATRQLWWRIGDANAGWTAYALLRKAVDRLTELEKLPPFDPFRRSVKRWVFWLARIIAWTLAALLLLASLVPDVYGPEIRRLVEALGLLGRVGFGIAFALALAWVQMFAIPWLEEIATAKPRGDGGVPVRRA